MELSDEIEHAKGGKHEYTSSEIPFCYVMDVGC